MTTRQLTFHDALVQREVADDRAALDEVALAAVRAVRVKQQASRPTEGSFVPCLHCGRMTRLSRSGRIEKCGWCGKGQKT